MPGKNEKIKLMEETKTSTKTSVETLIQRSDFVLADGDAPVRIPGPANFDPSDPEGVGELVADRKMKAGSQKTPISEADLYLDRLRRMKSLLASHTGDLASFKKQVASKREALSACYEQNLKTIFTGQRKLEKTWRELDAFFQIATAKGQGHAIKIANLDADVLRKDRGDLFKRFAKLVPNDRELSPEKMFSMIVLPSWLRKESELKRFGELGLAAKATIATDLIDKPKFEQAIDALEQLGNVKGNEAWKGQVVIVGNYIRIRKKNAHEKDDLFISPSIIWAAQVFAAEANGLMAIAQAGDKNKVLLKTPDDSYLDSRWPISNGDSIALLKDRVISVAMRPDGLVFWGVETLSNDPLAKQYSVRRVKEYIEKCLMEYLNGQAWSPNSDKVRKKWKEEINALLRKNAGEEDEKIILGGQVESLESVDLDSVNIKITLRFKHIIKDMEFEVVADYRALQERGGVNVAEA